MWQAGTFTELFSVPAINTVFVLASLPRYAECGHQSRGKSQGKIIHPSSDGCRVEELAGFCNVVSCLFRARPAKTDGEPFCCLWPGGRSLKGSTSVSTSTCPLLFFSCNSSHLCLFLCQREKRKRFKHVD